MMLLLSAVTAAGPGSGGPETDSGAAEPEDQTERAGDSPDSGSGPGKDHKHQT